MNLAAVLVCSAALVLCSDAASTKTAQGNELNPVVKTTFGALRGSVIKSRLGKSIFSFRGIRFAKPPIGNLRFQPPAPLEKWEGIQNATEDGFACPQPWAEFSLPTSEDCLFLNVYTTKLPKGHNNPKRPVMVFFHPGGFYSMSGHSKIFGPHYIMDQDIVLVTTNYRLGALGFLSTLDEVLPGNYGMKDQVATLRWVKENIAAFGGDPDSVTIAGYSAGSISVFMHMISPMSQGLFHRAIGMSASPFIEWYKQYDYVGLAKRQAAALNCPTDTSHKIKDCLMKKDAQEIALSFSSLAEWSFDPMPFSFSPAIEMPSGGERFLTGDPTELYLSGKFSSVPVLTGISKDEFSWKALEVAENASMAEDMDKNFYQVAPIALLYERNTQRSHRISQELRKFYLKDQPISSANGPLEGVGMLFSDAIIIYPVDRASKVYSAVSSAPLFYYRFSYQGRYSHFYWPGTQKPYGVVHHDDLIYLFYLEWQFPYFNPEDPEIKTVERMTKLWANFIQTGNPTPERSDLLENVLWEPLTPKKLEYLDIGSNLVMKNGLYQDRMKVWDRLFPLPTVAKQHQSSVKT